MWLPAIHRGTTMKIPRRQALHLSAGAAALAAVSRIARAQGYPARPIRLVVPFPPGGAFDTIGRPWAEQMKSRLGTLVIENIGGGGGSVGAAQAARARPDGYTLLLGGATTHITEALLKNRPQYDPLKDLEPISGIAITAFALAVHPSVPANDLKQLIAYAMANPGKLSYGSAGTGSLNHLTGEAFKLRVGLSDLIHVPYRGAGPAIADILAGQVPMIVPAMTNLVLELHRAGKLKVLAVTHGTRLAAAPDLPTAAEQGFDLVTPNFVGVFAPTETPKPIIDHIARANLALLADDDYRQLLISGTFEPHGGLDPVAYRSYVESELARWRPIVATLGLKID
jgi:tripartite-type tricarboxylate transporter receptor subunit TctC